MVKAEFDPDVDERVIDMNVVQGGVLVVCWWGPPQSEIRDSAGALLIIIITATSVFTHEFKLVTY